MIWDETDKNGVGEIIYLSCKICEKYPAMELVTQKTTTYETHGPYCRNHWLEEVNKAFHKLQKELDDQYWGDMPEKCGMTLCQVYTYDLRLVKFKEGDRMLCPICYKIFRGNK